VETNVMLPLPRGRTISATDAVCQLCGARLILEQSLRDAEAGESLWIGQCENQHWWLHSPVLGCIPIDPGGMAADEATTTTEDDGTD